MSSRWASPSRLEIKNSASIVVSLFIRRSATTLPMLRKLRQPVR